MNSAHPSGASQKNGRLKVVLFRIASLTHRQAMLIRSSP